MPLKTRAERADGRAAEESSAKYQIPSFHFLLHPVHPLRKLSVTCRALWSTSGQLRTVQDSIAMK